MKKLLRIILLPFLLLTSLSSYARPFLQKPYNLSDFCGIGSFFDHNFPLSIGSVEPASALGDMYLFTGKELVDPPGFTLGTTAYSSHEGWDIYVQDCANPIQGRDILAAAPGTVERQAFQAGGYGNYLYINHGVINGVTYKTIYAHLANPPALADGSQVQAGDVIGLCGKTGSPSGDNACHLHFGVLKNGIVSDPFGWIGANPDPWADPMRGTTSEWLWETPTANANGEIIVDDTDASFTEFSDQMVNNNKWKYFPSRARDASGALYGNTRQEANINNPTRAFTRWAIWGAYIENAGDYDVYVYIPNQAIPGGGNLSQEANYIVHFDQNGTLTSQIFTVDQAFNAGSWARLGNQSFPLAANTTYTVQLIDEVTSPGGNTIWADKVKWVPANQAPQNNCSFSDVGANDWYAPYITKMRQSGVVAGYADGTFRPNQQINRAEFLKFALKAQFPNQNFDNYQAQNNDTIFRDVPINTNNPWYAPYVYFAKDQGIISGNAPGRDCDGNPTGNQDVYFCPSSNILRAEATQIIVKTFDLPDQAPQAGDIQFTDILDVDAWFYDAVYACTLNDNEIVRGYPDGTFGPLRLATRAEAIKMICNAQYGETECKKGATCAN